ncbi:MAG: ATP-binding response regulator [Pseudomonadales bacterium]
MPNDGSASTVKSLEEELVALLAKEGKKVPIPVFLTAAMIAALASSQLPAIAWASWLALVAAMLTLRWVALSRLPGMSHLSGRQQLRIAVFLSGLHGVAHALSLGFIPYLPEFERAIQSMLLVAMCTASIATSAGYKPVFLAYQLPIIIPLSVLWAISPGIADPGWKEVSLSLLILMMGGVLTTLATDAFKLFRDSFDIRLQQMALNKQLQSALDDAEAANNAKTRFLASASHDLRQPIHALSLFSAALSMRELDERSRDIAQHMDTALQSLASQLDALLDISKLDAGVVQANNTQLNLKNLLAHVYEEFVQDARDKGLDMVLKCSPDAFIETDQILFMRVIRNLLGNAIKYSDSGQVSLVVTDRPGFHVVTITDTGHGIAEQEQAHIFEEFYQVDNPQRDRTKGLGLGLAIVKRLADLLQIDMQMQSTAGEGTVFSLTAPAVEPIESIADCEAPLAASFDDLHVLVVDDEAEVAVGMQTLLEGMGCEVAIADCTRRAVASARAQKPDIILVDFRLRGQDNGIDTVQTIQFLYPDIPAILISGDTAPDRLREAEEARIELLHKPVPVNVLKQAITRVCNL